MHTPHDGYSVSSAELSTHSTDIGAMAEDIDLLMQRMKGKLTTLQATWTGKGANQYAALNEEWSKAQTKVRTALAEIGVAVGSAGTAYAQVEADVVKAFTPNG
ncbi:WXG100 family type VII secretion target [Flexivirga caeni]|uniref:ESAT-6-like protein n=1 Tax=Flexivirga caeni TaxID=2294115 RepID=A0A3M9MF83_9MICO|nr:WXG100 family type VII secretion target [Flexivirga caeni]RNI23855.1 WXG100 family type VII secretion target [Flexivirga caeni]